MKSESKTEFARGIQSRWIRELVPGQSFADVGGLWGTVGEKVTAAYQAKARSVTMIDTMPAASEWWEKFLVHAEQKGVPRSAIGTRVADLERENFAAAAGGTYDYVNCSGVLYHVPNPMNVLRNLSRIANRFLSVSTQIIPEHIEAPFGSIRVPPAQALFIPSLTPEQKAVLKHFYDGHNYKVTHINRDGPPFVEDNKFNYGPSFWLPTVEMVKAWMRMFGWDIIDSRPLSPHGACFLGKRS